MTRGGCGGGGCPIKELMREKYLWLAIAVLTALTLGQACYIYQEQAAAMDTSGPPGLQPEVQNRLNAEKAHDSQWEELERWRARVQQQIGRGDPLLERDFDIFFNDRFFSGRLTPFTEMERIRAETSGRFGLSERLLFDGYWDKWFEQRMLFREFRTEVGRTDKDVTISVTIPGLSENTVDIDITDERIRIAFSAKTASGEKLIAGILKKETYRSFLKILPLPVDAAPGTGKIKVEGETIRIRFDLRKAEGSPGQR